MFNPGTKYNIFLNIFLGFIIAGAIYFFTPATMTAVIVQILVGAVIGLWSKYSATKKLNFFGMFGYYLGSVMGIMATGLFLV